MSGCLATSIFDKKPSRLHNTLVNIYGDDEAGLKRAATEYFYFESDSFKEDVGFDWQTLETIDRKGIRSKITSEEAIILGYVNEQLEPNVTLFGKKKLPKVQRTDGSDKFIEGKPFEGYDESDIREFVDNTIFHGLGKMKGLERIDFEGDVSATVSKELEVGGTMFKIAKEILELTDFDIKELKKRIIDNLRMKQLALQDNDDLEAEVNNYPNEDDPNAPEQKSSNAVVKVDAFTVNSKNTASANVKIMLSFIPEMASYTEENGVLEFTTKKGKYMPVKFKDMDKIWRKLEDNISNIFTKVTGNQIESVLDQMMTEIYKLGKEDPTIMYVYNKLKSDTLADYKKIQFAQAFTKQKIVFFTSEVSGNNLGDLQYKFFDAGKSTSKENTLRSIWETGLLSSDYYSQDEKTSVYKLDSKAVAKDIKLVDATLVELRKLSKERVEVLSQDRKDRLNKVLENLGIPVTGLDPNTMTKVLKKVQAEAESKTFSEVRAYAMLFNNYVNPALKILSGIDSTKINSKSGNLVNSIKSNPLTVMFAEVNSSMRDDISESTTMGANNKMMWGYSLPTYIDITMHRFKTGWIENDQGVFVNPYIESLRSQAINKNSKWLEFLSVRENTDSFYAQTFNSFQKTSDNGMDSVDNKDIRFFDQLSDQVNKMLNGTKDAERSIYYSPTNADKGRLISFVGPDMVSTAYTVGKSGNIAVSESSKSVEQVLGYFEDEYSRMTKTWNTVTSVDGLTPALPLYVHMHIDKKGKIVNEQGVPIGNGFKSQLFPELSPTYQTSAAKTSLELDAEILRAQLYDSNNRMKPIGITDATEALLKTFIAKAMTQRIRETQVSLEKQGVFKKESDVIVNKSVDKRVWDKYSKEAINRDKSLNSIETSYKITGDYVINGIISNVEYSKVFAGDVAYFKDTVDYNKRIPATYTDGKYLVGIDDIADKNFKIAVINTIEIPAKELEDLKRDFIKSLKDQKEFMPDHIKKIYDDDYIDELAQTYTDAFKNVNAADAQAWISLKRWKFLKTKLDGWSPKQEESYQRMIKGKFTHEDLKMAAQPLKGVYFNRDQVTGVPTYLKYSQMVMIPGMFKGTSLEQLTIAMQEKDIDEVITLDGVKVGAVSPTTIHTQEGGFVNSKDMQFNVQELSNLHWKLQQQLPVKGMKDNMDLGSQMQKNVISNIKMDAIYGKIDGGEITGKEIVELIHETISELADIGFNSAINSLGTNPDGTIKDKGKFYNQLAKSLEDKNMPSFIVDMISRGYDLDAIPQVRYKAQNVISATINNAVSKTTTPGGSMIQMSNVGVTIEDLQAVKDNKQNGIYLLKDNVTDLKRPKIDYDNNTVSSGQIFIPHSFIAKHIPDYRELSREDLMKKVDYKLLQLIGYRIPNQKMSSIQPLEIVGILPESMGDAVMMYSEITTQTGSDFDIDKTYIMMPEYRWDEKAGRLRYIESKGILKTIKERKNTENLDEESVVYNQGKKQLRNQLFELYNMVLKNPLTFADGMSSIDGAALKNGINETHNNEGVKLRSLDLMNPYYQLGVKFDNSVGKAGVGLTANQMVDHVFTQIHDSVLIDTNIGIGNIRGGSQDFSEIYDTDGKVITDTISMFLNGYVDIAKDPFITKGNFNTVTSNLAFFMIRGGVPLDYIIKFIGQPAFFEVTETKLASESLVLGERPLSLKEASNIVIAKYQEKLVDLKQDVTDTLDYKDLSKVSKEKLQSLISSKDESDPNYLQAQIELLKQLATIDEISRPLSELILASKSDVNGGGPDIASHMTGLGRYNKVLDDSAFTGISERFAPNSMLGSKTLKTLQYLNRLDEELFLSASPNLKPIYTILSINKKGSEYILDKQFVQDIEKEVYGYAIGDILKNIPELEISKDNVEQMFKSPKDRTISDRVAVLKIEPNLQSNALIQNLEFKQVKAYKYVTLDNFKAKPNSSLDEIQRGWQQLLDTPKYRQFGLDLVKYAFTTSGFSRNRNSIYDVLPMEISDILNRNILQFKEETNQSEIVPEKFLNNFLRSPNGENWVSTIYPKSFGKVKSYTGVKGLSGFNPDVKTKLKELGLTGNPAMLFNIDSELDFTDDKNRSEMLMYNKLKNDSIIVVQANVDGEKVSTYFKNEGIVHIGLNSYHFLTRTHKLGLNEPGLKIYEYGIDSEKSFISTNNPLNYDKIEEFSNWMKDQSVHEEFSMNTDINENIHNNKNAIRSSEAALDNLTRRGIIEKKC